MKTSSARLLIIMASTVCFTEAFMPSSDFRDVLAEETRMLSLVVGTWLQGKCSLILFTDGLTSYTTISQLTDDGASWGVGVFEVGMDGKNANMTQAQLSWLVGQARRLRQVSRCVTMVVVSVDPAVLAAFAEWSLKGRLLVWSTRLLVVTRLPREDLGTLLASHWTFSMNNAMALNIDQTSREKRYNVLVHLPYSPNGARVVPVALWSPDTGLRYLTALTLFPEKYRNFHGATVNVTVLPYEPYWVETIEGNTTRYSGINYNLLVALCQALNFTFRVIPSRNWNEVSHLVEIRKSFMATIIYSILPERLHRWDFTYVFEHTGMYFVMATPVITPSWLSFCYPLGGYVWIAILISVLAVCITLIQITSTTMWQMRHGVLTAGSVVLEAVGSLLGQGLYGRLSTSHSNHILVGTWLFLGVVLGTAYRGSLIASLTLPRLPSRPETVEELVKAVDRVAVESYAADFKNFFSNSDSEAYKALGSLMDVGGTLMQELNKTLEMRRRAYAGALINTQLAVSKHFTNLDGTTSLYVGRQSLMEALIAWKLPPDAPFKPALDDVLRIVTQAGLYEQWTKESLEAAARGPRIQQRMEHRRQQEQDDISDNPTPTTPLRSLTITHIQGPLLVLALGLVLGLVAFILEKLLSHSPVSLSRILGFG